MSGTGNLPAKLDPPLHEAVLDAGGLVSHIWAGWFQSIADRVAGGNVGGVRSGTFTTDGAGSITLAFVPAFPRALTASPTVYDAGLVVVPGTMGGGAAGFVATGLTPSHTYAFVAIGY